MPELMNLLALQGSLSPELTSSKMFRWWVGVGFKAKTKCWLNSTHRSPARDRIFEKYLVSRGIGPNGRAYILASLLTPALAEMTVELELPDFLNCVKLAYPDPVKLLMEVLVSGETDVKEIKGDFTEENQASIETCLETLISIS